MIARKKEETLVEDPRRAWEPYRPGPRAPWDAARVAHLHRRAGFGATWGQLERDLREGFESALRRILDGELQGPSGQSVSEYDGIVAVMEESAQRRPSIERVQMLWLYRLIFTPFPLAEAMTLAWHSHYATSQAKVNVPELMLDQNRAQRALWRAPISKLHRRMLGDGAMRRWLDGLNSTKVQPNENLAREFLELFALGEGHYSERDVREVARALAGWVEVDSQQHRDQFDPGDFDAGPKTILGETGKWGVDDVVRIACRQSAAATHIARRLYRTFISNTDEPSPGLLAPLADAMRVEGDVDVANGIELVLRSRLFHSEECRTRRVKSPVDFAIGAILASELLDPPPDFVDLEIHLTKMGQRLFFPPGVAGWPGGLAWLNGQEVLARANFAAWITEPLSQANHAHRLAGRSGFKTPESWLEALAILVLGSPLSPAGRALCEHRFPNHPQITRQLLSLPEAQVG
ncbi:MAG: DUF1800 family protein [Isosphaerales bacterium]